MTIPGLGELLPTKNLLVDAYLLPSVGTSHGGPERDDSMVDASVIDGCLCHFKEVGIMENLTRKSNRWLRKTTAAVMVPLLLAQVLIALVCISETLKAGAEIRREMTMEELRSFLDGEKKVTIMLTAGGAIRSDRLTVLSDNINLGHITKATNWKRYPWGSETSIPSPHFSPDRTINGK